MTMKNFQDIAAYAQRPFPFGYPVEEHITLSHEDNLIGALVLFIDSAEHSVSMALPNLNEDTLVTAVLRKLQNSSVFTQLTLPLSAVTYDQRVLDLADQPTNYVDSFGLKHVGTLIVVDGMDCVTGDGGSLTFTRHPVVAAHTRRRIDLLMTHGE